MINVLAPFDGYVKNYFWRILPFIFSFCFRFSTLSISVFMKSDRSSRFLTLQFYIFHSKGKESQYKLISLIISTWFQAFKAIFVLIVYSTVKVLKPVLNGNVIVLYLGPYKYLVPWAVTQGTGYQQI
jgi:hypothetical protein